MTREALLELAEGRRWRWKAGELFIGDHQLTHNADNRVEQARAEHLEIEAAAAGRIRLLRLSLRAMRESELEPMTHRQQRALRSLERGFQKIEEGLGGQG